MQITRSIEEGLSVTIGFRGATSERKRRPRRDGGRSARNFRDRVLEDKPKYQLDLPRRLVALAV